MIKLKLSSLVLSIDNKYSSLGLKVLGLFVVTGFQLALNFFLPSPLSVTVPISAPIIVSSAAPPTSLPSEPISGPQDVKASETKHRGSTAIVVKHVRHADVSGNIVRGFDRGFELEDIGDLKAYGNQALSPRDSVR